MLIMLLLSKMKLLISNDVQYFPYKHISITTEWSHQTYPGNGRNCHTASACPNSRFIHIRVTFGGPTLYIAKNVVRLNLEIGYRALILSSDKVNVLL